MRVVEIKEDNKKKQVLFYNLPTLDRVLKEKPVQRFLTVSGYPSPYSLEKYVEYLVNKMRWGRTYYEIGVFLGYPLKDVIGFMGYSPLKFTGIKGWRYYGDRALSEKIYARYQKAREEVRELLKEEGTFF